MSGHSHWKNIKRDKDADAKKRSLAFSKMGKLISLLAKEGGGDIEKSPALRSTIEKAKEMNFPKEKIERAIKRGLGELESESLEKFTFEAYGPEGAAIIVEGVSDNIKRSISDFRSIVGNHGGKIAETGSVKWLFERAVAIEVEAEETETIELLAIEAGALDFQYKENRFIIYFPTKDIGKVNELLRQKGFDVLLSSLVWVPKNKFEISEEGRKKNFNLFRALLDSEDIQDVFSNIKDR